MHIILKVLEFLICSTVSRYLKKISFQACTILHDQIDMTSVVVALIDGANIGMVQLLHDANFLLEVLSHLTCDFERARAWREARSN